VSYFTFSPSPLSSKWDKGPLKHLVEDRDRYGNIRIYVRGIGTNIQNSHPPAGTDKLGDAVNALYEIVKRPKAD
jgi:hypothetical protein